MACETQKTTVAHLVASPFLGGPERQMLGMANALPRSYRSVFMCLMEGGKAQPFVDAARAAGHIAVCLEHNFPHLLASIREVATHLSECAASILLTHNYKPNLIGYFAARRAGIPAVAVSRGWTWATWRVRLYEAIDRRMLRLMPQVVCVSRGQADKVIAAGVPADRVQVIPNSIDVARFAGMDCAAGRELRAMFPDTVTHIVLAVGRLSQEKGFDQLVKAAAYVCAKREDVGFALIGDGPLKAGIFRQIQSLRLGRRFILAGFRKDVDRLLPHAAVLAQSSHTEGMPNVVLEAMAAAVPVVATRVGGTPELVVDGQTGLLVPPADPQTLADGILTLLGDWMDRAAMGAAARARVEEHFTFASQAAAYERLIRGLVFSPALPLSGESAVAMRVAS